MIDQIVYFLGKILCLYSDGFIVKLVTKFFFWLMRLSHYFFNLLQNYLPSLFKMTGKVGVELFYYFFYILSNYNAIRIFLPKELLFLSVECNLNGIIFVTLLLYFMPVYFWSAFLFFLNIWDCRYPWARFPYSF